MTKPYVLTDDLSLEFSEYMSGVQDADHIISDASNTIEQSLKKFFPDVNRIPAERIFGFLTDKVSQSALPVISLAGVIPSDGQNIVSVEASRTVKLLKENGLFTFIDNGILPRNSGLPAVSDQFNNCVSFVSEQRFQRVNLLDDVVFSGNTVLEYVDRLENRGLSVDTVIANVVIGGAVTKLQDRGIKVNADYIFDDVVDEVCMRDFIVGAPGGGRNLMTKKGQYVAVPYLYPFADVDRWATISCEQAVEFSKDCLEASLGIWSQLAPDTKFGDLEKPVFKCDAEAKITETLETMLKERKYVRFANTL